VTTRSCRHAVDLWRRRLCELRRGLIRPKAGVGVGGGRKLLLRLPLFLPPFRNAFLYLIKFYFHVRGPILPFSAGAALPICLQCLLLNRPTSYVLISFFLIALFFLLILLVWLLSLFETLTILHDSNKYPLKLIRFNQSVGMPRFK
jgi:hypothetical protein